MWYLPPATASAINYAYSNTLERSPPKKLLADIFALEPETLDGDILLLPAEFMADVLQTNMKQLSLRLKEANLDKNARTSEDVEMRGMRSDFDSRDGLAAEAAEAAVPEPKSPTEAAAVYDDHTWGW